MNSDTRNVIDEFKGLSEAEIIAKLDSSDSGLEIAIENLERDFNMGTIVRSANAFGVRTVHVIGRRQWNKRGAMATDKYLHVHYYQTVDEFIEEMKQRNKQVIAVDNVFGAKKLSAIDLPRQSVLVFGAENSGISKDLLQKSYEIVEIEQHGSTRSINVGVAAGIVMYRWLQQHSKGMQ